MEPNHPETPAHTYLRLDASGVKNVETEWQMRMCVATLANTEDRIYGGYQY